MSATAEYLTDQARPHHPALLAAFGQESEAAVAAWHPRLDLPYGPHPRQSFDFFTAQAPWRGTLAYFHAGYWQARDKAMFRCLAPAFLAEGIDLALVNYPLCPDVSLAGLVEAARAAVPAVLRQAASLERGGAALVAAGHSAGAHIAVELALTDWSPRTLSPISGVAAFSGVYDLTPLLETPLNDKLRLDAATAQAASPLWRVRAGMPPALFAVGAAETAAFLDQNEAMHRAWRQAGNPAELLAVAGADHFSLLRHLQQPGDLLSATLRLF